MSEIKIAIVGASGRMGQMLIDAVRQAALQGRASRGTATVRQTEEVTA